MKAFVTSETPGKGVLKYVPKPKPVSGQVLVKVVAAAQNTADWMVLERSTIADIVVGQDFAGIVDELGPDVPSHLTRVGQRVAGFVFGGVNAEDGGSFAEYCVADANMLITIPEDMSFEDAAGLPHCALTAAQALWQNARLPLSTDNTASEAQPVLVWGGATAVGQFAIQLATLSNLRVITTASPRNFDLVKNLGAVEAYDYHDWDVSRKIRSEWEPRVAIDCASSTDAGIKIVCDSLSIRGGHVALVRQGKASRDDVTAEFSLVYTLLGQPIDWYSIPFIPEHYELGKRYMRILNHFVAEGKLRPTSAKVVPDGLRDAQYWIDYQKDGRRCPSKARAVFANSIVHSFSFVASFGRI